MDNQFNRMPAHRKEALRTSVASQLRNAREGLPFWRRHGSDRGKSLFQMVQGLRDTLRALGVVHVTDYIKETDPWKFAR
jgi:hypothetical protein